MRYFDGTINSRISTFNSVAILSKVAKSGWMVLLHHLLTVQVDFPNCSANHLPVFFVAQQVQLLFDLDLPFHPNLFNLYANVLKLWQKKE